MCLRRAYTGMVWLKRCLAGVRPGRGGVPCQVATCVVATPRLYIKFIDANRTHPQV